MSSLQRSRSLRKPATANPSAEPTSQIPEPEPRHGSPSRLPPKPLTRSATISAGSTSTSTRTLRSATQQPAPGRLTRAMSMRQSGTTNEPVRREPSRYPPSTTVTRQRPTTRPTSSDGPPTQTRKVPSHSRARSTTTAGIAITSTNATTTTATATGLKAAAPILRPPLHHASASASASASTTAATTRPRRSRAASPDQKPLAPAPQPRLRPAFSTLQQHYSPAKTSAPKPLTATFLAPPSPSKLPANVAASAETSRLQTELLQLHLLHRDAAAVDAEWRASAKEKLGERFAKLARASREVDDRERAEMERGNVLALTSWAVGGGLEERIQALDGIVTGLWTMCESGGRYARVVRRFERWVDGMCEVQEARTDGGLLLHDQDVLFIAELDTTWKDECAGLRRRLEGWKHQLRDIGQVPHEEGQQRSSLERMIDNSRILAGDMLAELDVMDEIEREALAQEDEWIERMNRDDDYGDDTPRAGAIWRVL